MIETDSFSPLVELARRLSRPSLIGYEAILKEVESIGFEQVRLPGVPTRKDVVKFTGNAIYSKDDMMVHVSSGTGSEGGQTFSHLSIHVSGKGATLQETISEVSQWLGADPEFPAKNAQFAVIEHESGWTPISLSEARDWYEQPLNALAHISVDSMGSGASIIRIVTRAS